MKKGEAVLQKRARGRRSATAGRGGASFIWAAAQHAAGVLAAQLQARLRLWQRCICLGDKFPRSAGAGWLPARWHARHVYADLGLALSCAATWSANVKPYSMHLCGREET